MTIDDLLKQKREKVKAAEEIRDRVYKDQSGEWRGDDEAKFDGLMADAEKISGQIDRMAKLDAASRSLEQADQPMERRTAPRMEPTHVPHRGQASKEDRAMALHGWFASGSVRSNEVLTDRHREAAQRCGISLAQKSISLRLAPFTPTSLQEVRDWEQRLTQVDIVSPDYGGHFTVPDSMMRPLEVALLQYGVMRQTSTVERTPTGSSMPYPTLNDTSNEGAIVTEGGTHSALDVEFNQMTLDSFLFSSRRVPVSWQYLQDNAINFAGRIGGILGERLGRITNRKFTVGTGTGEPHGIMTAATSASVTTANATTITYDNIMDLKHSVDPAYRSQGARFMFNDTTLKILKKIKIAQYSGDTTGQPLWRAGLAAGEPDTIDGDPYTVNQHVASGAAARAMAYGLLSKYQIRDVQDMTLMRLDELYAENGIVAFLAFLRSDGDLLDAGTHPVKYLTMGN